MGRTEDERSSPPAMENGTKVEVSGDASDPDGSNQIEVASDQSNYASTIDTVRATLPMISLYEPYPVENHLESEQESQVANPLGHANNESAPSNDSISGQAETSGTQLKGLPALAAYQKSYANSLGNNDAKAIKLFKEFESEDKIRRIKSELLAISQGRAAEELCLRILGPVRRSKFGSYAAWAKFTLGYVNSAAR
jgi:hypothetical protein